MYGKRIVFVALVASCSWVRVSAELTLVEAGGGFAPDNLAQAPGAAAFAIDQLDLGVHFTSNLNDGLYGNGESWIGLTGAPGFAGIRLDGLHTISSVAFGRDNQALPQYDDRYLGTFTLQVTDVASPDQNTPDDQWTTLGVLVYDCSFPGVAWMRHRYNFPAVQATGIRLLVPTTGLPTGTAIDELEVYADPGAVVVDTFALETTGGPLSTPSAADKVPTLAEGNLARAADAVPFATPPHPAPVHQIPGLNDGLYGNSNSWLGNDPGPTSGKVYAGIYFDDGPKTIAQIAFGRDNTAFPDFQNDRADGRHVVQYTEAEFDPTDDAATDAAPWVTVGSAAEHYCYGTLRCLRRLYSFPPVSARAVRVLTQQGNVIDELEVGEQIGTPPPPELRLVATGGPVTTPAGEGDVPTLPMGNLARAADAMPFATPSMAHECHDIAHLNDGLYGNCASWLANEVGGFSLEAYAGLYFTDGPVTIQRIAIGRDNTGGLTDRADAPYLVQYTMAEFEATDDASVAAVDWSTAGQATRHLSDGTPGLRHVYCLEGIQARAVRVVVAAGSVVDELEILSAAPPIEEAVLAEVGGTFADDNLATAPEATAFAIDALVDQDPADPILQRHTIPHLNDGTYGNEASWIGRTGAPGFAGISLGGLTTVASVAFGRDNTALSFDRFTGAYAIQYTTAAAPDATTSECDWVTIARLEYDAYCPDDGWLRHRYNFTPVEATAIRLVVPESGLQPNGTCIDELEVYAAPGAVTATPCIRPVELALLETGGPVTTPAQPGHVPTLQAGNFARAPDAVPFGTPPYPDPAHTIPHLNDGAYGNANSWLGNELGPASGRVYAGVYFAAGPRRLSGIALGRDNLGQYPDRAVGAYLVESTMDTFDPADDAATDAARWTPVGLASAHLTDLSGGLRHRYGFEPVDARAVRVRTALYNAIDELELLGEPPPNSPPHAAIATQPDPPTVTLAAGSASITLDATASDDGDGGTQGLTYAWEKVSGPGGDTIAQPAEAVTTVALTQAGEYVYRLTVDDGQTEDNSASADVTVSVLAEPTEGFRRGDADADGAMNITDGIYVLNFLFLGGETPTCLDAADSNGDNEVNITDGIYILNYLFLGGDAIPDPGPDACGPDPTPDDLPECAYPQELCP